MLSKRFSDFFSDDLQLQFGESHADATMDAEAERHMAPRPGAVDDEAISVPDHLAVAVARDVPHQHAVALLDSLASKFPCTAALCGAYAPCGHDTSSGVIGPTGTHLTKMNSVWP
jgi:hypothetical protein